jgi:3-dehydroquinate synthase
MLHDKKVSGGQVVGVWPEKIGQVRVAPLGRKVFERWYAERKDAAPQRVAAKASRK